MTTRQRSPQTERIASRRWSELRTEWPNYTLHDTSPWPVPDHEIGDLPQVRAEFDRMAAAQLLDDILEYEIPELRAAALLESVIGIFQGATYLRAACTQGAQGYQTASRSTAYHAAFVAMKAICGLLGVIVCRSDDNKRDYQIDLWAPRASKSKHSATDSPYAIRIIKRQPLTHNDWWGVFTRLIRVLRIDAEIWTTTLTKYLKHCPPSDFAWRRNRMHYRVSAWTLSDLMSTDTQDDWQVFKKAASHARYFDTYRTTDFAAPLAIHMLNLGTSLIRDLGQSITALNSECDRMDEWIAKCALADYTLIQ